MQVGAASVEGAEKAHAARAKLAQDLATHQPLPPLPSLPPPCTGHDPGAVRCRQGRVRGQEGGRCVRRSSMSSGKVQLRTLWAVASMPLLHGARGSRAVAPRAHRPPLQWPSTDPSSPPLLPPPSLLSRPRRHSVTPPCPPPSAPPGHDDAALFDVMKAFIDGMAAAAPPADAAAPPTEGDAPPADAPVDAPADPPADPPAE